MKKILVHGLFVLSFFVLGLACPEGYCREPWKIGHVRSAGSAVHRDIMEFTEAVKGNSGDEITFEIYPANKLGDYSVVQERVSFGEVEMYVGPFGTAVDRRLSLAFTPFLVDDWDAAKKVYDSKGPLVQQMASYLAKQNIKIIGGYPVYFGGIALTRKPDTVPGEMAKKGIILRIPPMKSFELTARALGYTPYPITWMYAKMGLKTGMVQGIIGGGAEGYAGLPSLCCYIPVNDHFEYWFVYMNLDLWQSLSPAQQEILTTAASEMEKRRYSVAEEVERKSILALQRSGVEILEISAEERAGIRRRIEKEVWPKLQEDIGEPFQTIVQHAAN